MCVLVSAVPAGFFTQGLRVSSDASVTSSHRDRCYSFSSFWLRRAVSHACVISADACSNTSTNIYYFSS